MRGLKLLPSPCEGAARGRVALLLCALALCALFASGAAGAQSGRRQPPPRSPVPPAATPTPDASSSDGGYSDSDTRQKPKTGAGDASVISFIVFEDDTASHFLNLPISTLSFVVDGFIKRLGDSRGVSVSGGGKGDRRRAREHAKVEKDAYTILLQVDGETQGAQVGSRSRSDLANLIVRYYVYAPSSATLKLQGQVYMRPYQPSARVGGINLPLPVPSSRRVPIEYVFEQAGRDAADRVLAAFNLRPPD